MFDISKFPDNDISADEYTDQLCPLCKGQKMLDAGGGSEKWCWRCCGTGEYMSENEAQQRAEALENPS
jgi:hypothetical protein